MNHSLILHKRLYMLLRDTGNMDQRHELVLHLTSGRTNKSQELTTLEITRFIEQLQGLVKVLQSKTSDFQRGDKMRKRVLSLFHQYGYSKYCPQAGRVVIDFERLNEWMMRYSYLKKGLNKYKYSELPKLISQAESMLSKYLESV